MAIKNFNISKFPDGVAEYNICSFNINKDGFMPDHFSAKDTATIESLFQLVGLEAIEDCENCYDVHDDDVQKLGDAFVAAGLTPILPANGMDGVSVYPLPDGSIPGAAKKTPEPKPKGMDPADKKLLELMGGTTEKKKITTEDCIALVAQRTETKAKEWKRLSKRKQKDSETIVRVFENRKTKQKCVVFEDSDGGIAAADIHPTDTTYD